MNGKHFAECSSERIMHIVPKVRPSLTDEVIEEFRKDSVTYSRT